MTALIALVVVVQTATGAGWWILLRRSATLSAFEVLGMGIALGTVASMLTAIGLVSTRLSGIGWLVPTMVVAPILIWAMATGRLRDVRIIVPRYQGLAWAVGLIGGLALVVINWRRLPLSGPMSGSFIDLYFFEALSRGLAEFGPAESILMTGGSLRYHWFAYGWAGELSQTAGAPPFVVLTRVLPIVTLVAVTAIVAAWAGRLSRVRWVPVLAVLLVVVGGYAGALYGSILNFDSPSQAMATLWLLAFAVAFLAYVERDAGWPALLMVGLLAAACTGGKASHAVVAAGGAGLVLLVGALRRTHWWRRALLAAAVSFSVFAITYVTVLSGVSVQSNLGTDLAVKASTWQGLDPMDGPLGVVLGTTALLLAIVARLGGLGWLVAKGRMTPDVLFAAGSVLVGLVAMLVLRQGINELWFVLAASAPGAVLSAVGVAAALRLVSRESASGWLRRPLLASVAIAVPASAVCLVLSRNWTDQQALLNWLAPIAAWLLVPLAAWIVVASGSTTHRLPSVLALSIAGLAIVSIATRPSSLWTASRPVVISAEVEYQQDAAAPEPIPVLDRPPYEDTVDAAQWMVANTSPQEVVATSYPYSAIVPALTGHRMYIAGTPYQAGLGRADEVDEVTRRDSESRDFAADPSLRGAYELCRGGVDLVWLDQPDPGYLPGEVVFSNGGVTILRIDAVCE